MLALVPFLFMAGTRLSTLRDAAYIAGTQWIPGIWILYRLGGTDLALSAGWYALGFLAFVSFYEIGYLANDVWDARRHPGGRKRVPFVTSRTYIAAFVAIRISLWLAIGLATGWIESTLWLGAYSALTVLIVAHNVVRSSSLRIATFWQLACLRFLVPLLGILPREQLLPAFALCVLFYVHFRYLAYLDAKSLLVMPERKALTFGLGQLFFLAPIVLFLAFALDSPIFMEFLVYFALLYAGYAAIAGRKSLSTGSR
jgi:hypothetical protein